MLPTGKILAVINARTATDGLFGLMRANADGTLDSAFGIGGFSFAVVSPGNINNAFAYEMAVTPNGRIVVAGSGSQNGNSSIGALVRFLPNGALDNSYGSGGVRFYPDLWPVSGIDVLNDGSLLLSGSTLGGGQTFGFMLKTLADPTAKLLPALPVAPLLMLLLD